MIDHACHRCGQPIPPERLELLPETRLCVSCSAAIGGDFEVEIKEENLGSSIVSKPFVIRRPRRIETVGKDS